MGREQQAELEDPEGNPTGTEAEVVVRMALQISQRSLWGAEAVGAPETVLPKEITAAQEEELFSSLQTP